MSSIPIESAADKRILPLIQRSVVLVALCLALASVAAQTVSISPGEEPVPVVTPSVRIEFDTASDKFYRIESSEDLSLWKPEGYAFAGNGGRMSALVSNHGLPRLFYRIRNNASPSETAPVIPYAAVSQSSSTTTPSPITAAEIDPANDKLVLLDSSSPGSGLRSIPLSELANIPGFTTRWGAIQGSIADQADLMSALNQKYSAANPPGWQSIANKPTTLFGYGITDAVTTSTIGFMERFSRYPEGSVLSTGRTFPEYGNAWRFNITGKNRIGITTLSVSAADSSFNDSAEGFVAQWLVPGDWLVASGFTNPANNGRFRVATVTPGKITVTKDTGEPVTLVNEAAGGPRNLGGGYPPYITNGALRAADKTLIYIGAPTATTNGRFTISFEVELKPSVHPSGQFGAAITLGIKPSELLLEQGGLNLGNLIHCQLTESGVLANGIYGLLPAFDPVSGTHPVQFVPGQSFPKNVKHLIHCVVEGDEMKLTSRGGTIVYRDSRIPAMIGSPDTHWFYETNGDSLGNNLYANVWHLHRIWVNAPELDQAAGWGVPDTQQAAVSSLASHAAIPPPPMTAEILGTAGNKTHLLSLADGLPEQPGAHERTTIHGSFPNGSPKELTLQLDGTDVWSTGSIADHGEWTIEIDRVRETTGSSQMHIRYESETTRRFGYHNVRAGTSPAPSMELKGSSTHDGDVIVRALIR
jgi:hypothetical protein